MPAASQPGLDGHHRSQGPCQGLHRGLEMLASMRLCANVPMQHAIQTALGGYQSINELILPGGRLRRQRDKAWELLERDPRRLLRQAQGRSTCSRASDPKCVRHPRRPEDGVRSAAAGEALCWCKAPASTGRHRITSGWCSCPGKRSWKRLSAASPASSRLQAVSKAHEKAPREPFVICRFIRAISCEQGASRHQHPHGDESDAPG